MVWYSVRYGVLSMRHSVILFGVMSDGKSCLIWYCMVCYSACGMVCYKIYLVNVLFKSFLFKNLIILFFPEPDEAE